MKNKKSLIVLALILVMTLVLAACGNAANNATGNEVTSNGEGSLQKGGTMIVKVNPEIKVNYDENGLVKSIEGVNDDGLKIITGVSDFLGKEVKVVIRDIISKIGAEGYLLEEVEGEEKQIILEVEKGSVVPGASFIDEIIAAVEDYIKSNEWAKKDGVEVDQAKVKTPKLFIAGSTDYDDKEDVLSRVKTNDTNYDNTKDSNYGEVKDDNKTTTTTTPVTAPIKVTTPSKDTNYDDTNYDDNNTNTNYDDSNYGTTPAPAPTPAPSDSNYDDTNYDDPVDSNYDDPADSNYDDSDDSGYDNSDDSVYN